MNSEKIYTLINVNVLQNWHSVIVILGLVVSTLTAVLHFFVRRSKEKLAVLQRWATVLVVLLGAMGFTIYLFETRATATLAALHEAQDLAKAEQARRAGELSSLALSQQAEEFKRSLTKAQTVTAAAKQSARHALAETNREKIELISLRENLKLRRLTTEKRDELTVLLRTFPDLPIEIGWISSGGQEAASLASDIVSAISNAGIKNLSRDLMEGTSLSGIEIIYGIGRFSEANAIARFLVEAGLSSKPVPGHRSSDPYQLEIVIGWKP